MDARFPPDYDAIEFYEGVRDSLERQADKAFQTGITEFFEGTLLNSAKPYFPGEPLKEFAIAFRFGSNLREELPIKSKAPFLYSSIEHRALSILYENFYSMQKILGQDEMNIYSLEALKDDVARDSSELIGYWMAKDKRVRASRPGSEARTKRRLKMINSVKEQVEKKGTLTGRGLEITRIDWQKILLRSLMLSSWN